MRFSRLLLAALPFVVAGLLNGLAPADRPKPARDRLAEVKTWEDLLHQPRLELGEGVTVRLGVEATRCPVGSGVLLYAYTEGYGADLRSMVLSGNWLGPVLVSVACGGASLDAQIDGILISADGVINKQDKRPRLFARVLVVDRPARYRVAVRDEHGKELAAAVVSGTQDPDEPYHTWSPLLLVEEATHEGGRRTSPAKATYLARGIALPGVDPAWGLRRDRALGRGPLPKLIPERPDPGLKLTVEAGKRLLLRVTAKGPIITVRPDIHFLTRWWVNGRPVYPTPGEPLRILKDEPVRLFNPQLLLDSEAQLEVVRAGGRDPDVVIWLKLFSRLLRAKSGDRVEVQLLYCPSGWVPVRNPPTAERAGDAGFPRLTNRAAFTLP